MKIPLYTRLCPNNGNPGDFFILLGLQWLIEQSVNEDCEWILLDKFNKDHLFKHLDIVQKCKFLIYAGMPQYNSFADWKFWYDEGFWTEFISSNKIRVLSFAGGSGYPSCKFSPESFASHCMNDKSTVDNILFRNKHCDLFTVRDSHSHALLNKLGIENHLLPCSALFAYKMRNVKIENREMVLFIPPSPSILSSSYVPESYSVYKNEKEGKNKFVFDFSMNIIKALEDSGRNVEIVCHSASDFRAFESNGKNVFYSNDYMALLKKLASAKEIVGSRIHSVIPAFGMGKKCVGIGIDTRWSALWEMKEMKSVPIDEASPEKIVQLLNESNFASDDFLCSTKEKYIKLIKEGLKKYV